MKKLESGISKKRSGKIGVRAASKNNGTTHTSRRLPAGTSIEGARKARDIMTEELRQLHENKDDVQQMIAVADVAVHWLLMRVARGEHIDREDGTMIIEDVGGNGIIDTVKTAHPSMDRPPQDRCGTASAATLGGRDRPGTAGYGPGIHWLAGPEDSGFVAGCSRR